MIEGLYNKKIVCTVCSKEFEVTKVKSNACKISKKDSDFMIYYEGINPIFYDVWVCEFCGYAAQSSRFEKLSNSEIKLIKEKIVAKWNKRSYNGERTIDNALDSYKLALLNLDAISAKASDIAKVCIRIGWLYRMKNDSEKEVQFLRHAAKCYNHAYMNEDFPIEKMDKGTCMYIIAELNRRIGEFDESIQWFNRTISNNEVRKNAALMEIVRDMYQLAKKKNSNNA